MYLLKIGKWSESYKHQESYRPHDCVLEVRVPKFNNLHTFCDTLEIYEKRKKNIRKNR